MTNPEPEPGANPDRAFAEPSRQSPLAVVILAWRALRQLSVVNIVFIGAAVASGRLPVSGIAVVGLALAVLAAVGVISWWRFVFMVADGELRVDRGVLSQEHLAIPLNRVQTVSMEQGLLHQILGLTQVSVDTAGSSEVEFRFDALDRSRAEGLQQLVARHRSQSVELVGAPPPTGPRADPDGVPPAPLDGSRSATGSVPPPPGSAPAAGPPAELIAERTFADLVRVGVGSWPWAGLVVIFPLLAVIDEVAELAGFDLLDEANDRLDGVGPTDVGPVPALALVFAALVFVVAATLIGWLFQVIRAVVTDWEMTLTRTWTPTGDALRRDAGLFNRSSVSANLARVQNVRVTQSLLERRLGIHAVTLQITGETNIRVPGSRAEELERIDRLVMAAGQPLFDRRVSRSYVAREVRTGLYIAAPVALLTGVTLGWWALLALLIPLQSLISGWMYWRSMRWGFDDRRIGYRHGMFNRRWHHVEFVKAQSVSVRQSWFERRRGLATFTIRSAEAEFTVPFLVAEEAGALRDLVLAHVESTNRSWM